MRKYLLITLGALALAGCSRATVEPGTEGVVIDRPYFFGHGGVRGETMKPGTEWFWASTEVQPVNVTPIEYNIDFNDIMTSDGVPVDFHATMRIQITDAVALRKKFGEKWFDNNITANWQTLVRQEVRKHTMEDVAIDGSAIVAVDAGINSTLIGFLKKIGLPVKLLSTTVGKANPPAAVLAQREETARQQQRVISENQKKLAEDARKKAELARAAADSAYRTEANMTIEQQLDQARIEAVKTACARGTCIIGNPDKLWISK